MDGEDAEATLHAVLSFLDECELAEAAELLEEQEDASQQLQGDGAPAKPKKRRRPSTRPRGYKSNRTRDERRFELMRLRQNVVSLEKELEQLRTQESSRRQQAEPKSGGSSSSSHSSSAQSPSSSAPDPTLFLWEDIALGQMNQRKRAELENARLKNSLEQQIKVAKALQKLIYRRATWEVRQSLLHFVLVALMADTPWLVGGAQGPSQTQLHRFRSAKQRDQVPGPHRGCRARAGQRGRHHAGHRPTRAAEAV